MDLGPEERRPRAESVVPMINVVFLLLIFFLMTATIAPPEPFEVSPPESVAEAPAKVDQALFVSADGKMAWGNQTGEAALAAIAASRQEGAPGPLIIRADRAVEGIEIARLLTKLAAVGVTESNLVAEAVE